MKKNLVIIFTVFVFAVSVFAVFAFDKPAAAENTQNPATEGVQPEASTDTVPSQNKEPIGIEKAKELAAAHFGFSEDSVRFTEAEIDKDRFESVYEIEFCYESFCYECDVDMYSGEITEKDTERCDHNNSPSSRPSGTQETAPAQESRPDNGHIVPDHDDDRYDDDRYDDDRYDDDSYDDDCYDDDDGDGYVNVKPETGSQNREYISGETAITIALKDCGLDKTSVYVECEFDFDDGKALYEIEIENGFVEYEYEIDALSGEILEKEVDYDD